MEILITTLIFLAVLFVLVLVHEWGHFIVAKKTGMRVDEFGIGFPPRLFSIQKGETLYSFNALPIGGFVKIFGENADEAFSLVPSGDEKTDTKLNAEAGSGGTHVAHMQKASDFNRSFVAKSKWAQAAVLLAGISMNILFAWLLFVIVFAVGVPTAVDESEASSAAELTISQVLTDSPADQMDIPVGATVLGLSDGATELDTLTPSGFVSFIAASDADVVVLEYETNGGAQTAEITLTDGIIADDVERPAMGVALALVETVQRPIHIAAYEAFFATVTGLKNVTIGLSTLLYDSVRGTADFSQVAGPIGIAGLVGDAAEFGFTSLLLFTAFISLNLAVINLLPIPALDGGRLVFVAVEALIRRPINPEWMARVNFVGFALLMLLMIAVTYNDVLRLF